MKALIIIAACLVAGVSFAGKLDVSNPQARQEREVASVMATNVSLDALIIEINAANNATKLQAAMLKLVGRMQAEEKAKKKAKDKAKKVKVLP